MGDILRHIVKIKGKGKFKAVEEMTHLQKKNPTIFNRKNYCLKKLKR